MATNSFNPRGVSYKIAWAGALITLLAACSVAYTIWESKKSAEAEWSNRLAATTIMMSAHARQSIGAADLVLRSITDNVEELAVRDQDSLRKAFGTQKTYEMLRAATKSVPQIDVATVVAMNGDVINFTRSYPPPTINLADRDYFQAHLADPSLDVFLSVPVRNRGDGGWTFYLARKIRDPDGKMIGLVLTGLFSDFFSDFYKSVSVGPGQAMSLYRSDGRLLARFPVVRTALGASFAESATFLEALGDHSNGVAVTSTARTTNRAEEETRIIAARRDADYPLVVSTNAGRSIYLEQWRRSALGLALVGSLLCFALATATIIAVRMIKALDVARTEALKAAAVKSRFVSTVSHELRTPLSAIISGSAQLLDYDLKAEPLKLAVLVSRSANHLMLLINDILQFSLFESGKETVAREPFVVREAISQVMDIARSLPNSERLSVGSAVDADVPETLIGDKGRISQILLNVLGNAIKYTQAGEVFLRVSYPDGVLRASVRDTGRGISIVDQPRIFEPFERVGNNTGGVAGTGLGLAISRRLAALMHGRIDFVTEVGKGSTFTLQVPAARAQGEPSTAQETRQVRPRPASILLAEDVSSLRMLMSIQLRKEGFDVTAVSNGREAVEAIQKATPDFVLMDIQMPEMDGLEAARQIRKLPGPMGQAPIIAITAVVDDTLIAKATEAGMNGAIAKPLKIGELKAKLASIQH